MPVRIGELLLKEKRITPEQLQEVLAYQKANGGKLGLILVKLGFAKDEEITALLSKQYGVPSINLHQFEIDPAVIKLIPPETAQKYQIIPLSRAGATLTIAMTDPTNVFAMDDIKFMTGYNVEPVVAQRRRGQRRPREVLPDQAEGRRAGGQTRARSTPRPARSRRCRSTRGDVEVLDELEEISAEALQRQGEEAPVIKLVNVHPDVGDPEGRERHPRRALREGVPGPVPHRRHPLQHHDAADEVPRCDHLAHQDHGEARHRREAPAAGRPHQDPLRRQRRRPRTSTSASSCLPTLFGEKIVMRLLDKDKLMLDMTRLGFESESLAKFEVAIQKPWGMVLVTGPTGSGKTNTLYSSISAHQHARDEHHDRRGPGRVQPGRRQPGAGPREHRPQLRRRAAQPSSARTPTSSWSAKSATSRRPRSRSRPR